MDLSYKQEVTVGGLVLVAIGLFIAGTTWLSGRSIGGDSDDYWHVQFRDVAGLKVSSAVRVSGVPVGRVETVELVAPGKVLVGISLQDGIEPKTDATALVSSIGFVGDAVVDLSPGAAAEPRPKSQVIMGSSAVGLMDRAGKLSDRVDTVLMGAQAIVNQRTADELHATLLALQGTLKSTQRMMDLLANPRQGPMAELSTTMTVYRGAGARLDTLLANPGLTRMLNRSDSLAARLDTMTAKFAATGVRLDTLLAGINRGQGTFGKLATDTTLYTGLQRLSESMAGLLDELKKNPGKISPTFKFCC